MASSQGTKNEASSPSAGAIIPAAGFGTRMESETPKQFLELAGVPILIHTLRVFLSHPYISSVVVVLPAEHLQSGRQQVFSFFDSDQHQQLLFATGGVTRQESVRNGLAVLPQSIDIVLVHDGARPMVTEGIVDRCIRGAVELGAVIAAVPVKDTLKRVDNSLILETVDRSDLWQAQTPQAIQRRLLEHGYEHATASGFTATDEASILEHAGIPVAVVEGSEANIKITRPADLTIAAGLMAQNNLPQSNTGIKKNQMKIGHGYDVHQLVERRKLILGGVEIPYKLGLAGHSDADVLTHALMDAILGASGLGDIGRHFPDSDAQYRGADSLKLLAVVMKLVHEKGLRISNADITIICQQPKLAPYLAIMQTRLAEVCAILPEQINIKATTTEKLGFAGRGEGIAAHAVLLLQSGK